MGQRVSLSQNEERVTLDDFGMHMPTTYLEINL